MSEDIFEKITYTTANGDTIILSDSGLTKWRVYSHSGFKAPEIKPESRMYANGSVRTLAAILQSREVTLNLLIWGKTKLEAANIYNDLVSRLLQIGAKDEWGKLTVRRPDGIYVQLNCLYTGGLNISEKYPRHFSCSVVFEAGDPYFYDEKETVQAPERLQSLIYLNENLFLGDWTLTDGLTPVTIENDGEMFYPVFEITGPASVIRVTNVATGKTLAMNESFSLLAGETLLLDCRENRRKIIHRAADGTETDISYELALGSSLVFPITKGTNILNFYYTDIQATSAFRVRYQKRYYSV